MHRYTVIEQVKIRGKYKSCIIPIRRFFPKRNSMLGVTEFTWKANLRAQAARRAAERRRKG
jgi:hypothetical protein